VNVNKAQTEDTHSCDHDTVTKAKLW